MPIKGLYASDVIIILLSVFIILLGLFGLTIFPASVMPVGENKPTRIEPNFYLSLFGCTVLLFEILVIYFRRKRSL